MGVRREGREAAIQFLYQRDLGGASKIEDLTAFYAFRGISPAARRFSQQLVAGAIEQLPKIDLLIQEHAQNYQLDRLSAVDRNILRLAVYEMTCCLDTPPVVAINEAINIAKKYSTEESGRFANGVLDHIKKKIVRPAQTETPDSCTA